VSSGFERMYTAGQERWMGVLAEIGVIMFGVYLFGKSPLCTDVVMLTV
jgi:hypothetical protein